MDITAAIDVAVGLVLMYLVLSLLCTTINESIASFFSLRANTLSAALHELIDNVNLKALFDDHGMVNGNKVAANGGKVKASPATSKTADLPDPKDSKQPETSAPTSLWSRLTQSSEPSYLSGRSVALALIGSIDPKNPTPTFQQIKDTVTNLPDSNIRDALLSSILEADGKVDNVRDGMASWFDGAMDRLSGAYKRDLQTISLIVGFVIAAAFNADSLYVGTKLWQDRSLSQMIAQSAPELLKSIPPPKAPGNGAAPPAPASDGPAKPLQLEQAMANIKTAQDELRGLPIGWAGVKWPGKVCSCNALGDWAGFLLIKILGLAMTAAALMMGAPFWFDLLQKIMNLRGTGDKPGKSVPPQPTT